MATLPMTGCGLYSDCGCRPAAEGTRDAIMAPTGRNHCPWPAVGVAVALSGTGPREFWFHFGDIEIGPSTSRRRVKAIENLVTGERHVVEWGGVRLRVDQQQDPALLFRCFT